MQKAFHLTMAFCHTIVFITATSYGPPGIYFAFFLTSLACLFLLFGDDRVVAPLLVFSATYTLYLAPYFLWGLPYHYLTDTQSLDLTVKSLSLQHAFYYLWLIPRVGQKRSELYLPSINIGKGTYLALVIFMLAMLAVNTVLSPPNIGAIYTGENNSTVWIEYSFPFLLLLSFNRFSERYKRLTLCILILYVVYPFLYSRRLQMLMVLLLIYYRFYLKRVPLVYIYTAVAIVFVAMRIFESTRMGVDFSSTAMFITTNSEGIEGSNQGGVMVASTVYMTLIETGAFDLQFRTNSLVGNLLTGILPGSINFSETYINLRALEFMPLPGNGGLTAVYLYLWLGLPGVWILSYLYGKVTFSINQQSIFAPLSICVLMTFPKFHSYNLLLTNKALTIFLAFAILLLVAKKLTLKQASP